MSSLGREPQERTLCIDGSPGGAADVGRSVSCGHETPQSCRRFAAVRRYERENRGSRPGLTICRRSAARNQPHNASLALNDAADDC